MRVNKRLNIGFAHRAMAILLAEWRKRERAIRPRRQEERNAVLSG